MSQLTTVAPSSAPSHRLARILIVDDHPAVREGLQLWISRQPDMEVCGEAADIPEALQLYATTAPDVVIIDISLRSGNGMDLIKRLKSRDKNARLLVCSMHSDTLFAERALRAGAMGYVNKDNASEQMVRAIRKLLEGKIFLSEGLAEQLLTRAVGTESVTVRTPLESLSDRELEVFQHIGQGLDTKQIAEKMCVSPKTVDTYRTRIKEKLHVFSNLQLIQQAMQWTAETAEK